MALFAGTAEAQNLLYIDHGGTPTLVQGARGTDPCVEYEGKLVVVHTHRFALKPVEEFLPVFVSVRKIDAKTSYMTTTQGGSSINNEFHFKAECEAGYPLDNVFIVLEMNAEADGKSLFVYEVGHLSAHEPKEVQFSVALSRNLGPGQYVYHIFAGGPEVLHSGIPMVLRERSLDRMVARRAAKLPDGAPKPFVGPVPEYPEALKKSNVTGDAVISLVIDAKGGTRNLAIKSATDPAFGESALAAARLWRFIPKIKDGQPVDAKVDLPFHFGDSTKAEKS